MQRPEVQADVFDVAAALADVLAERRRQRWLQMLHTLGSVLFVGAGLFMLVAVLFNPRGDVHGS